MGVGLFSVELYVFILFLASKVLIKHLDLCIIISMAISARLYIIVVDPKRLAHKIIIIPRVTGAVRVEFSCPFFTTPS